MMGGLGYNSLVQSNAVHKFLTLAIKMMSIGGQVGGHQPSSGLGNAQKQILFSEIISVPSWTRQTSTFHFRSITLQPSEIF